ncbi:hypothetical protein PV773_03300 [Mesorhizobium sp. CC13]|uniref:hypothetical protein n=1 Tax=Mesorhizobium sp. CC13 TaxID=3029194 RepID=UPI003266FB43
MEISKRLAGLVPDGDVYRVIGYYINRMAGLEYVVDQFLFALVKEMKGSELLSSIRSFPARMAEKIDLIALAYIAIPKLRSCGDADDFVCINSLVCGLEEVWSARNILVHGKIHFTETTESSFRIRTHQFERVGRNKYREAQYDIGVDAILDRLNRARYLEMQLRQGTEILQGKDVRAQQDELRRGRSRARELVSYYKKWGYEIEYANSWLPLRDEEED